MQVIGQSRALLCMWQRCVATAWYRSKMSLLLPVKVSLMSAWHSSRFSLVSNGMLCLRFVGDSVLGLRGAGRSALECLRLCCGTDDSVLTLCCSPLRDPWRLPFPSVVRSKKRQSIALRGARAASRWRSRWSGGPDIRRGALVSLLAAGIRITLDVSRTTPRDISCRDHPKQCAPSVGRMPRAHPTHPCSDRRHSGGSSDGLGNDCCSRFQPQLIQR